MLFAKSKGCELCVFFWAEDDLTNHENATPMVLKVSFLYTVLPNVQINQMHPRNI